MPNHFFAATGETMPFLTAVMSASGFAWSGASETCLPPSANALAFGPSLLKTRNMTAPAISSDTISLIGNTPLVRLNGAPVLALTGFEVPDRTRLDRGSRRLLERFL